MMSAADAETSENVMRELMKIGVGSQIGTITATDIEWRSPKRVDVGTSWVQKNANLYLVLSGIEKEAALTFDYVMMLIVASLIALGMNVQDVPYCSCLRCAHYHLPLLSMLHNQADCQRTVRSLSWPRCWYHPLWAQ